jgi:hypothetical protein
MSQGSGRWSGGEGIAGPSYTAVDLPPVFSAAERSYFMISFIFDNL